MILVRKALRDVAAMGFRAVLLVLVIGAGVGMAFGIRLALHDVQASREGFYQRQHLADLDVRLNTTVPTQLLMDRAKAQGASVAETRLIVDGSASVASGRTAAEVLGIPAHPRLDQLAVVTGQGLSSSAPLGADLNVAYATASHTHVGDSVRVSVSGHVLDVTVRGLIRSPEYLLATANPQYLIPQPGSLAVIFLPKSTLAASLGTGTASNDLVANFTSGSIAQKAHAIAAGLSVARITPRSQQYSLRFTNADLRSFGLFVPILAVIFALVGFLLIGLSLRRIIHAQRRELGTLLAIGYSRAKVLTSSLLPAVILAIPGALAAVGITIGIARLVAGAYAADVGFPVVTGTLEPTTLTLAGALAVLATLLASVFPAWSLLRLEPASAMRGNETRHFEPPRWLRRATGSLGPSLSYAARSLARRPLLAMATTTSLALAIGLGAAMNVLATSTNRTVAQTFAGQRWSVSVDLTKPVPIASARGLAERSGATTSEPVVQGPARLLASGRASAVELVGLPNSPALEHLNLTNGRVAHSGQIVLSEQTAQSLRARPGQVLTLVTAAGSQHVTVSGTTRTLAAQQSYTTYTDAAQLLDLNGQATSFLAAGAHVDVSRLVDDARVARVTTLAAARTGMSQLVSELTGLIDVLLAISLGVGGLFLASSLALSFLDREGEFATLRALGYGTRQVAGILSVESIVQSAAAGVLSIPAGLLVAWPLSARIGQAWFRIGMHPAPSDFALAIVLALVLATLVALQATRRVIRLDIAHSVRARLIG